MSIMLSPPAVLPFPAEAVEACLRDAIATAAVDREVAPGAVRGKGTAGQPVWEPEVDSVVALEVILALEARFGVEFRDDVVPPGGFANLEDFIMSMLNAARAAFAVQRAGRAS